MLICYAPIHGCGSVLIVALPRLLALDGMGVVVVASDARDGGTNDGSGPARRALPDHAMRQREHLLPVRDRRRPRNGYQLLGDRVPGSLL